MSYGFDLGRLNSNSTGASYVDSFDYHGGSVEKSYSATAYEFATSVDTFILPAVNIPASQIPVFPTINTTINKDQKNIVVSVNGGNVSSTILVFVR